MLPAGMHRVTSVLPGLGNGPRKVPPRFALRSWPPLVPAPRAEPLPRPHPVGRSCWSSAVLLQPWGKSQAQSLRAAPLEGLSGWKISLKKLFSASEEYESLTS